jgi:hypothetical protein
VKINDPGIAAKLASLVGNSLKVEAQQDKPATVYFVHKLVSKASDVVVQKNRN